MKLWAQVTDPILHQNPVTLQILGICSALAVTTTLAAALTMSAALTAVIIAASGIISLIRTHLPSSIRLIVQIIIVASLVIVVDQFLQAFFYEMSQRLSVFVSLIATNCVVLGRTESFALHNRPLPAMADALGNGLGYSAVLIILGTMRELFGRGTIMDIPVLPTIEQGGWFEPMNLMLLAPSAFFLLGGLVWAIRSWRTEQVEKLEYKLAPAEEPRR
ncbi:NADH:ubiquinone reductase (Na(+)-transporting) subunit D [Microvirga guangxiensis]|uniref:Na+-transporting NADH:ubiquinone oxidoreductase subunit D n=1 Tax=Microvirga guangxiensis TaxID=549386 RepID=A0A1G5K9W6_9HYPH|nr:NADH:ubiquinone reductase (Na(+)-transporting) subunit D [Microvirga guangxiensis]SCY97443.1 Na+-transporting NADH:ubiquinone oxidoreductase subunit D [Microvirga guangxiensis]